MKEAHAAILRQAYKLKLIKGPNLLLLVMANYSREGWRPKQLSEVTGLSAPLINMAKATLIDLGYVREQFPHRDQRGVVLYLTDNGVIVAEGLWAVIQNLADLQGPIRSVSPD